MRLLFLAATAREWQAACPHYSDPLPEQELLDFIDARGYHHFLCITGVGPVNAALAAGLCLATLRLRGSGSSRNAAYAADAAVNLGVAGSFDLARAPLGSAWRVTREIWPEYGLACASSVDARALGFPQWQYGPDDKTARACSEEDQTCVTAVWDSLPLPPLTHNALSGFFSDTIHALPNAVSLTVAGVTADVARAARLQAQHGALLENMEGFALALACARHGLPLLELRTVSNAVGPRLPEQRDFPRALAALRPLLCNLLKTAETCLD